MAQEESEWLLMRDEEIGRPRGYNSAGNTITIIMLCGIRICRLLFPALVSGRGKSNLLHVSPPSYVHQGTREQNSENLYYNNIHNI